jgi:hypothetical protein
VSPCASASDGTNIRAAKPTTVKRIVILIFVHRQCAAKRGATFLA